jgi:DNA-binding transcriptional LysR family regulator
LERSPKTKELQGFIDAAEQRVDMLVPNVLVVPTVVNQSDLVALLPWAFAQKFSESYPVSAYRISIEQQRDLVSLLWHSSYEDDSEASWFRSICAEAALEIRGRIMDAAGN